ncbi:hypothetical protein AM571_PC00861 (plasmid) [Rhizobium etli 8C-3]|uniref:Uncharacterized protein n=1 Tax=Rhizobium etli 8C-3 TaxID=538025 RepID=A0A1L5PEK4_RHIET|nr:hypothetical protein AM571_PC00861 [Rhizobium etli 8C-3]
MRLQSINRKANAQAGDIFTKKLGSPRILNHLLPSAAIGPSHPALLGRRGIN